MEDTFKTISKISEGIFKDKGSKFLAFSFPVTTEAEVKAHILELKKKYHDARHHCYAYRLGVNDVLYRMNDDGEPSGTAGKPIYGQLLSFEVTNILVLVVRYFGGTLLGTSGLITAYRASTADCLANATIIERYVEVIFSILFVYEQMNQVMKIIKEEQINIISQKSETQCSLKLNIRQSKYELVCERLLKIDGLIIKSL